MDAIWWEERTSSTRFRNVHSCDWMLYLTWVAMTMTRHRKIHYGLMAACYLVPVWVLHSCKEKVRVVFLCSPIIFNRRIALSKHNSPDDRFPAFWADLHEFQLQSPDQKMNVLYILIFPLHTWPSLTTNIALQFLIVLSLWAIVMLVLPSWALSRALKTLLSLSVSRAEVASSSNSTGGFLINARAMAIRCFWPGRDEYCFYFPFCCLPPESCVPFSPTGVS